MPAATFGSLRHCRTEPALTTNDGREKLRARGLKSERERDKSGVAVGQPQARRRRGESREEVYVCEDTPRVAREYQPAGWQGSREQSPVRRGIPRARVSFVRSHVRSFVRSSVRPCARIYSWRGFFTRVPAATVALPFSLLSLFFLIPSCSPHIRTFVRSRLAPHSRTRHLSPRSEHRLLCFLQRITPPSFVLLARAPVLRCVFLSLSSSPLPPRRSGSSNQKARRARERV